MASFTSKPPFSAIVDKIKLTHTLKSSQYCCRWFQWRRQGVARRAWVKRVKRHDCGCLHCSRTDAFISQSWWNLWNVTAWLK